MLRWFSLGILVVGGCSPTVARTDTTGIFAPSDTGDSGDGGGTDSVACTLQVVALTPPEGQASVPTDTAITVTFDAPVGDEPWGLFIDGVDGDAELTEDRTGAVFTPDAPLDHDTDYTVVGSVCDSLAQVAFHTRGAPIDPDLLVGHTYFVPWKGAEWEYPALADDFVGKLDIEGIAIQVVAANAYGQSLDLLGAVDPADEGTQDPACWPSFSYQSASFAGNPDLAAGPTVVEMPLGEGTLRLEDTWLFATFTDGGEEMNDVSIVTRVDTRALDAFWGQDVCDMAAYLDDQCEPCADGVVECLPAKLTVHFAPWKTDLDLEALRTSSDGECT